MKMPAGDGMLLRFTTGFTLIPVLVIFIWWPFLSFAYILMVQALVLLGTCEYFKMARQAGIEVVDRTVIPLAIFLAFGAGFPEIAPIPPEYLLLVNIFLVLLAHMFTMKHTIAGMATSVFGLIYIGYFGSFFIRLHNQENVGPALVTILLVTIGCSDTGAYLVGKAIGHHKLAPRISPKKTIEGSVAALISAALGGAILYALQHGMHWTSYPTWPLGVYMIAGVYLSVIGQFGDLTESLLKRNSGIKDSGAVFPGHGGALDRCDAFLFGAPALCIFLHIYNIMTS